MKKVLIVDDTPTTRKLIGYILKKREYFTAEAEDGVDALEKLGNIEPDLIIVDLNMPNMDGIQFVKNLRSNYYHMDTPVIMISTSKDEDLKRDAIQAGANLFLNKPVQPNFLINIVEGLLKGE